MLYLNLHSQQCKCVSYTYRYISTQLSLAQCFFICETDCVLLKHLTDCGELSSAF